MSDPARPPGPVLVWEVTPRCDLRCPYCYNVWNSPGREDPAELATTDALKMASIITGIGPASVILTGGEPLLRDDLEELAHALASAGVKTGVATNGRMLDRARVESLVRSGVSWFDVGLPAADDEGYLKVTGSPGAGPVRRTMMAVKASGAGLNVAQILTKESMEHTVAVIHLAAAIGADSVVLNRFVPGGRGLSGEGAFAPGDPELRRTLRAAGEAALRFGVPVHAGIPVEDCIYPHGLFPGVGFGSCVCGDLKWAVGPDGTLRHCEQSSVKLGSLLEIPFNQLTQGPAVEAFRESKRSSSCESCGSLPTCGGGCRFLHPATP